MATDDPRLTRAYTERAIAAVLAAKMAIRAGFKAGVGQDHGHPEWDDEWRVVLFVELPDDGQISWHIAPADQHLLDGLPVYENTWNGTWDSREGRLVTAMPCTETKNATTE